MNLKRNGIFFAGLAALAALFAATGCSTALPYAETRSGNYLYINPFSHKPATPQEHLEYASSLKERGKLRAAGRQFNILTKRWPESAEAASAKQNAADIYFARGKNKKAFEAYEELIAQYYTRIQDYDAVLERQLDIAGTEMSRKRMRWLFGGYRAPERAVPYFESIIQNAPQWERAPEMQYMIGQAYQNNGDMELAVVAYATVEYRYPDSAFAEKAAFAKIGSLKELVKSTPYSVDVREQAELSAELFPALYPGSEHLAEVKRFSEELTGLAARYNHDIAGFYERVPRPPQTNAAAFYYRKVIENYGGTEYAVKSAERLQALLSPAAEPSPADTKKKTPAGPVSEPVAPETAVFTPAAAPAPAASGPVVDSAPSSGADQEAPSAAVVSQQTAVDGGAVEVTADRMEYSGNLLMAEGHVVLHQQGAGLQADRITVNHETGEIAASGNILMTRDGNRWEGQELVYNYKTREGTFGESAMYFDPAYITAETTERVSTNEFLMRNATITTCSGESPAVYAKAQEVRVIDENKPSGVFIKAKNVTFYVGPVPVFYMPVWQRHLGYRVFTFYFGHGGRVGAFAKIRAELHPTEWLTANSHLDLYSKRGLGAGQDFRWKTPGGAGEIKTYYINDSDPYDSDDPAAERALTDADRYRIKVSHREEFDDETYFATRLNWLSDPGIIEDFFTDEFQNEANPENFAVLQRSAENYAAGVRVDHRLNDFYTTVDRIPALSYDWYRSRIEGTPLYFESENNVGLFQKQYAETNMPWSVQPSNYDSGRFDTYNRLFLPLRFREFFNVVPRAGYRGTWYTDTPSGSPDENYRHIMELGTLTSFKAYKTLTGKSGFYGDGLRHVIEPYADYSYRVKPTVSPTNLYQFDEIDALDKQNEIRFGGRNFLQTKRGTKRLVNFLDSDIYTTYRFDQATNTLFGPLTADAQMSLTDNFFIQSDLEYDWYTHDLSPANARLTLITGDQSEYSFGYRYVDNERSLFTPSVKLFPNDDWSYEFSARYDGLRDEWEERKILINHKFDCIGMGVGYRSDEDDEHQFWVQFWLTAFSQAAVDFSR
jgi:lipopolysaccharide assembly outer membrane protein LptD (OstA)/TolA-binding protein